MAKKLDLSKSVYDLCKEYEELPAILEEMGFTEIVKPAMLNTVGRTMSIPKGATAKGISMMKVVMGLQSHGFELTGKMPTIKFPFRKGKKTDDELQENSGSAEASVRPEAKPAAPAEQSGAIGTATAGDRERLLRSYVERLTKGEDLETVRAEFVENFKEVDALEIANAEQHLIKSGVPYTEVKKLCDVHSALFHGATKQEQLQNAEKAVAASRQAQMARPKGVGDRKAAEAKSVELIRIPGHPLNIMTLENEGIVKQLAAVRAVESMDTIDEVIAELNKLRAVSIHYAKKGDVFYTLLKNRYDVTGPSDVMWTVDDEIIAELRKEVKGPSGEGGEAEWFEAVDATLKRVDEMIFKETNILFPIAVQFFSDEEWKEIGRDMQDYEYCLLDEEPEVWAENSKETYRDRAAANGAATGADADATNAQGEIVFAGGHMTPAQIEAVLNTIPMELTFVDHIDMNRYYNDNGEPKMFKRPLSSLDREVYSCHPPKIEPMVRSIISSFKTGERDKVEVWMNKGGMDHLVSYRAVRDAEGNYVGTLECVQNMEDAKAHYQE